MINIQNKLLKWLYAMLGALGLFLIQKIIEKFFPEIWKYMVQIFENLINFIKYLFNVKIEIRMWIIVLLGFSLLIETIYILLPLMMSIFSIDKIKRRKTKETEKLILEIKDDTPMEFYDIDYICNKTKILDQHERNELLYSLIDYQINNENIQKIIYFLVQSSVRIYKSIFVNTLLKKYFVDGNLSNISFFISKNGHSTFSVINQKNKKHLWETIIDVLRRLEFNSTNELLIGLNNIMPFLPRKYEKDLFIQLYKVSKSSTFKKDVAKTLFNVTPNRVFIKMLFDINRNNFYRDYYGIYEVVLKKTMLSKNPIIKARIVKIESLVKKLNDEDDIPF